MSLRNRRGEALRAPFFTVSGIYSCTVETIRALAEQVPALGGITSKSIGLSPRAGNPEPILAEYEPGCYSNAVGLANPGVEVFAAELAHILPLPEGVFLLVSIFADGSRAHYAEEFAELARRLAPLADGLELNLSCPHVKAGGAAIGRDPAKVEECVGAVKAETSVPIFAKLSPNFGNIGALAAAAERAGAFGISAINTAGPGLVREPHCGGPVLSNHLGGLSGAGILPLGQAAVAQIRARCSLPILAMGGIRSGSHVRGYRAVGAQWFGVGSALTGLSLAEVGRLFGQLEADLEQGTDLAGAQVKTGLMRYQRLTVAGVQRLSEDLLVLDCEQDYPCEPGQYGMLLLPGEQPREKPMSFAWDRPLRLAVRRSRHPGGRAGDYTERFFQLQAGDPLLVRGPYGQGLPESAASVDFISGGTGTAPPYFAARRLAAAGGVRVRCFVGARNAAELLFRAELEALPGAELVCATDDGSAGFHGNVVQAYRAALEVGEAAASVIACGPEKMMRALLDAVQDRVDPARLGFILEPYMKCAVGMCGICSLPDGRLACVDTHLVSGSEALRWPGFGAKRDATGAYECKEAAR